MVVKHLVKLQGVFIKGVKETTTLKIVWFLIFIVLDNLKIKSTHYFRLVDLVVAIVKLKSVFWPLYIFILFPGVERFV